MKIWCWKCNEFKECKLITWIYVSESYRIGLFECPGCKMHTKKIIDTKEVKREEEKKD